MPKIIIDTDKMAETLRSISQEERPEYLYQKLRAAHQKDELESWMFIIEEKQTAKGASIGGFSPAFLKFWETYPSRNGVRSGKAQAMKCWKKVKDMPEPDLLKACLAALVWQKKDEQWTKDKGMFVPMATTYINQRRWEDEGSPNPDEWEEYVDMNGATKKRRKE